MKWKVNHLIEEDSKERLKYEHHNSKRDAAVNTGRFEQGQRKFHGNYEKA